MEKKKLLIICLVVWIVGLPLSIFLGNLAISSFFKYAQMEEEMELIRYADKAESIINPTSLDEEGAIAPVSALRVLLADMDYTFDYSTMLTFSHERYSEFITSNGSSKLSEGAYAVVVDSASNTVKVIQEAIGVVSVDDLVKESYADGLAAILEDTPGAKLKLDKYAIDGTLITPVSLTVLDADGNKLANFEAQTIPVSATVVEAESTYIYNEDLTNSDDYFLTYNVLNAMNISKNDNRKTDKSGKKLAESIDLNTDSEYTKITSGLGVIKAEGYKVSSGNAFVMSERLTFGRITCLASISLFVVWTIIVAVVSIIVFVKNKNKAKVKNEA